MGVKLSNIASNSATVTVPAGDERVTVDYYPGRITDDMFLMLSSLDALTADMTGELNATLASFIKSWDLLEDDEITTIPITSKDMGRIYFPFKAQILRAIMRDIRPEAVLQVE